MTFRTRTFLGALIASSLALAVSTWLVSTRLRTAMTDDVEQGLVRQATLAAELLSDQPPLPDPDTEADRIGRLVGERVTFVAADGHVIGDSEVDRDALAVLENHASREEVAGAMATGHGTAVRHSATTGIDTMYAAAAVRRSSVAVVRVALPLTAVNGRVASIRRLALVGLGAGLLAAVLLTGLTSLLLGRRLRSVAHLAEQYRRGDFSRPIRDHARDEIGVVTRVLDDTVRELGARLADMARERAHMEAILTGMVEGVVLVNGAGRLVLTNPAVRSMLRLPDDAAGRHYVEVVRHPDIAAQLEQALRGERPAGAEVQLDRDAGRAFVVQVVPVAHEGGGGAVLVLHDVTDLRRADQMRRDFVANVSHELRTPLTAIRGYVEALQESPPDEDHRRFLEVIARQTLRMERLVTDLLRLARLDAGQESIERVPCAVDAVIAAATGDLRVSLDSRRQRIVTSIAGDAGVVSGDPLKLQDIFKNLLENAGNYSPEGATIEVTARRDGSGVEVSVLDRGPGIPSADLPRIFERFYRVDRSRTRDPGGTGLGLSIVRHLVELHGGRVSAAAREGGGSVFSVRLPAPASDAS